MSGSELSTFQCRNCRHVVQQEHDGYENPMCPNCRVERLTEMVLTECRGCDSKRFYISQPAPGESISGAEPAAICLECGEQGRIDDSGVWWS